MSARGWIPETATFDARLALIRWRMRWNIREAATACGVAEATWRGWELDRKQPHDLMTRAQQISDASGCDLNWLLALPTTDSAS
jgi:hypothetical protein